MRPNKRIPLSVALKAIWAAPFVAQKIAASVAHTATISTDPYPWYLPSCAGSAYPPGPAAHGQAECRTALHSAQRIRMEARDG